MIRLLSLSFLFLCFSWQASKAQVVITKKNFPDPGDRFAIQRALLTPKEIHLPLYDTSKDTFTLDLSYMSNFISVRDTEEFKPAIEADGGRDVPKAEYAFKASFGHGFFRRNGDVLNMVGVSPDDKNLPIVIGFQFDKPIAHLRTPLALDSSYSDSTSAERNLIITKVKFSVNVHYEVNGEGTLIIPGGQKFDVIRLRRKFVFKVNSKPIAGQETETIDSLITWEFYTPGIPNTILRVDARLEGGDTISYYDFYEDFLTVDRKEPEPEFNNGVRICAEQLNINTGYDKVVIYDLKGRIILQKKNKMKDAFVSLRGMEKGHYIAFIFREGEVTKQRFFKM